MKAFSRSATIFSLALGLAVGTSAPLLMAGQNSFYDRDAYMDLRGIVDRTQSDLRAASDLGHGDKQRERYRTAQDNLSKFDRDLARGRYDRKVLRHSIDDLREILAKNTLQPSTRDALTRDMSDLQMARDRR